MAKNDNVEFGKFRKNIMGTLSFEMKLPNMRKAQDFIVYPANEKSNYITIQSDTRFGKIEMTTGRGLMSQSHANGAYAVHLHIDKLVKFELTESQLEKLKEELAKTAGRNVGSAGVVSDNQYADKFATGGGVGEIKVGSKIGFLRPHTGRYEYADVLSIDGENVNLVVKHPKKRQWDNYFTETKSRISEFTNTESEDWKDGRPLMKIKYAAGGELVDKTIDHSGRYLDIVGNHRMLHIHLNDEGREMVMEERENGRDDEEIMYELFEDVAGNSDLMYHTNLGESGFGMTDASGVTAGYVYGDDGELEPADDTAVVYVDNDSYRRSPVEELLETHLVLKNSDFMAKGGMTFGGKMAGAGIFADGGLADDNVALFDSLKKGDTIKITFKDSISGSDEATLKVKSKTVVNKGKATESEKINFINTQNPHGVGWYAYKRKNGFVGFAWGDMAIWDVRVIDRYADGGNTDKPKRDFYEERTTNPYYSKAYNTEVINRVQVIYSSEYDQAIISNTISKADNGYVYRSEKVPITGEGISALYSILGKVMHGMFHGGNFAKGGTVDTYLPVGKEVSGREINNFIEYVEKFYGKNGLYAEDLDGGFTKKQIKEAVNKYLADLSKGETWGHGDSLDRERVRQYLQPEYSLLAKGGHMGKKTIEKVTLIFDGKEHKYDMVFIDGEFEEVLLPYSMDTPLFDYLEKEFDDWMDSASRDYHDMYFSDEAIYTRSGAIKGAIEVIDDTISEDRGKKKVYNLDKGEVDTMSAYS